MQTPSCKDQGLQKKIKINLQIFLTSHIHGHADEVLKVALKKLCLHLWVCFCSVSSKWGLPKELIKIFLCEA